MTIAVRIDAVLTLVANVIDTDAEQTGSHNRPQLARHTDTLRRSRNAAGIPRGHLALDLAGRSAYGTLW